MMAEYKKNWELLGDTEENMKIDVRPGDTWKFYKSFKSLGLRHAEHRLVTEVTFFSLKCSRAVKINDWFSECYPATKVVAETGRFLHFYAVCWCF